MSIERCEWSDLPVYECDHCPADARQAAQDAARRDYRSDLNGNAIDVISMRENAILRVVPLWPEVAPGDERPRLNLYAKPIPDAPTCACGRPLHDNATGCDECIDEMDRILGDTPWLVEQLELAITGQRAKRGAGRGDNGLPWNDAASQALDALRNELVGTVRILTEAHRLDWPSDTPAAMSRWLLTHIQLLAHDDAWTQTLRDLRSIEGDVLRIVDNPPALVFLGYCKAETIAGTDLTMRIEECGGPVYARDGQPEGKCLVCRRSYDVAASREVLEKALDDMLVTAKQVAMLATYLGIEQPRQRVRKLVNTWHERKRILAKGSLDGVPAFRYGEVRALLSATYETRDNRSI